MFEFDLRALIEQTLLVFAALFPIVNPIGGAPVFLAMTHGVADADRAVLARRIATNAFLLVVGSMLVGRYVIGFFGLSVPVIQVAGGLLVMSLAWQLLHSDEAAPQMPSARAPTGRELAARAFYPMTLPLTVGPGSISVAITLAAHAPRELRGFALMVAAGTLGALLLALSIYLPFRHAERLARRLGPTGTTVLLRLSAFILLCIGVQILWSGVAALLGVDAVPQAR
jgi:multiple antibiotic resistance protein